MREELQSNYDTRAASLWKNILEILKSKISETSFRTWFSPTKGVSLLEDRIIVEAPNPFWIEWIEEHYLSVINETVKGLGLNIAVVFRPAPKKDPEKKKKSSPVIYTPGLRLNRRYTFESFVTGKSNEFAYAACVAVAKSPARQYNPLFIYGGVGLGKTHLLQAIGNYLYEKRKNLNIYYTSAETFMNELINAIQKRKTVDFKLKMRKIDVLLLDDVQFLADKEMLQEEIFHTFNSLYDADKQIVMSSDRPPKHIYSLEERLVSRFQWGLVVDIKPPELETRIAITKRKMMEEKLYLPEDVVLFIAKKIRSNVREIEGALRRLKAYISITEADINLDIAKDVLHDLIKSEERVTIEEIVDAVAKEFGITSKILRSKTRKKEVALARQIAMYLARNIVGMSLKGIGTFFGGRDHSTVIHSIEKIEDMRTNPKISTVLRRIEARLKKL